MVGGLRTGILLYMQRQRMLMTPGEIAEELQYNRSTVQKILKIFHDHNIVIRAESPRISISPSIASLPPTNRAQLTRRTVSNPRGEKPYRLNDLGERYAELMKTLDKQLLLPTVDQEHELKEDKAFMTKLKSFGFNEEDIAGAQILGILNHRKVKVVKIRHRTEFGYVTPASIADAFKPRVAIRHRYRIA